MIFLPFVIRHKTKQPAGVPLKFRIAILKEEQ